MLKSISLQEDIIKEANEYAKRNGQSFSGLVRVSLQSYMKRYVNKDE